MDQIINYLLLVIIFVFDPLAISLVIAANFAFAQAFPKKHYKENLYGEKEEIKELISEPKQEQKQSIIDMMRADEESGLYNEEENDNRMNIIGQNGNEGTHYELEYESPVDFDDDDIEDILRKKEYEHSQIKNHTSDAAQLQHLEEEIKFLRKLVANGETKLY
jgi:hypothetical protein